jgi:nucleoside-triphosphatase
MTTAYLLTGSPGVGKTTLIREVLSKVNKKAGGFYTQEIRGGSTREGFKIVTLDGKEAVLAHTGMTSPYRVGKYGVDIGSLEDTAVAALDRAIAESELIVIDEIGKMELFSPLFRDAVVRAINSSKKVLGTIMLKPHPFADDIKRHPAVNTVLLTRNNRDAVVTLILEWLK